MTSITARAHSANDEDRRAAGRARAPADASVSALALERALQVDAPRLEGRHHAEERGRPPSATIERDRQHAQSRRTASAMRGMSAGASATSETHAGNGRGRAPVAAATSASSSPSDRELAHHAQRRWRPSAVRTATSRRRALPRASRQVGDVRAGDEQYNEAHRGQQDEQRRPDRPEHDGGQAARRRPRAPRSPGRRARGRRRFAASSSSAGRRAARACRASMKIGCVERGIVCGGVLEGQPDVDRRARATESANDARVVGGGRGSGRRRSPAPRCMMPTTVYGRSSSRTARPTDRRVAAERARPAVRR